MSNQLANPVRLLWNNEDDVITKRLLRGDGYKERQQQILERLINAKNICNLVMEFRRTKGKDLDTELESQLNEVYNAINGVYTIQNM